eukprot:GHVS01108566.1.p1 GENE.GHVS01108566.1~~GHVS01108566.1.p1  ORF type:complete len:141 (+),score=39.58 GHVS01108566.1:275-697(+)
MAFRQDIRNSCLARQDTYHSSSDRPVCRHYARGKCWYGADCKDLHPSSSPPPPSSPPHPSSSSLPFSSSSAPPTAAADSYSMDIPKVLQKTELEHLEYSVRLLTKVDATKVWPFSAMGYDNGHILFNPSLTKTAQLTHTT